MELRRWHSDKKNPPTNAGDTRIAGLIPGLGKPSGVGNGSHSSILAWKSPWTEEPGRLHPMGSQTDTTERLRTCVV